MQPLVSVIVPDVLFAVVTAEIRLEVLQATVAASAAGADARPPSAATATASPTAAGRRSQGTASATSVRRRAREARPTRVSTTARSWRHDSRGCPAKRSSPTEALHLPQCNRQCPRRDKKPTREL